MAIPRERLLPLLRSMLLMRRVEERVCELGPKEIPGNFHVYIGQEATGACVISLLEPEDPIFTTHRNHGHNLARDISAEAVLAELMVRSTGASAGKGGTQHIMSAERHTVATSIVGGSTILATGAALAAQVLGDARIGVAFLGDRSLEEGAVSEAFNLAGLWGLPVLYVCEHNAAVPYEPRRLGLSLKEVGDVARTYGLTTEAVDATDPAAVYPVAEALIRQVRTERRPAFLEARTPRWIGRVGSAAPTLDATGRTDLRLAWSAPLTPTLSPQGGEGRVGEAPPADDRLATWHRADPVLRMVHLVLAEEAADEAAILAMDLEVEAEVDAATAAARAAPYPPASAAFAHIFEEGDLWPK